MKTKKRRLNTKPQTQHPPKAEAESEVRAIPGIITDGPDGQPTLRPFPHDLLEEAEQEPDRQDLGDYVQVMVKLRQKGFTFREIAEWLRERGVDADHNAVYRVYNNNVTEEQERDEVVRSLDEEEQQKRNALKA